MTGSFHDLIRTGRQKPLWMDHPANRTVDYRRPEIESILRHRGSMLLLDQMTGLNLELSQASGMREIRPEDPVFLGHFPGQPIYPGALQIEMIGQLCLCLLHFLIRQRDHLVSDESPLDTRALKIHHALFVEPVLPGMRLSVQVQCLGLDTLTGTFGGQLVLGNSVLSLAVMEVYIVSE